MKNTKKLTFVSIVILFSLISSLAFPASVFADDSTPPPAETSEASPPVDEPVTTEAPVPAGESTGAPLSTEVPAIHEATPTELSANQAAGADEESAADQKSNMSVAEIVQAAAENNVTLADADGDPLLLGTVQAAETLTTGDPYFTRGGITYRFLPIGGCAAYGGVSATCFESATPIQAALDNVKLNGLPDDKTVYVEPGTYAEQLVIETAGLILMGNPGSLTVAGAAASAPILDGFTLSGTTTGITIKVEGVTISGFIIQNYDTAISQPVVVGSNTIKITNNTIQNNGNGIDIRSDTGSPGTNINYNVFLNNTGYAIINGGPNENNVQFTNAENNYWGCSLGPIVAYKKFEKQGNQDVFVGWRYRIWASPNTGGPNNNGEYITNPDPNCALLYGSDKLWNFQINSKAPGYSPYKLIINSVQTTFETTPTSTPTNTPTSTPTNTPTNTPTSTPTNVFTNTPTQTPTNTPVDTATNTPTSTPTDTPTNVPTNTPTATPTGTLINNPTQTPTSTPTPASTTTAVSSPTNTPAGVPTDPPDDGSPAPRPSVSFTGFVPVTGGEPHAIAAGIAHTCAIIPEGGVQCWGNNNFGQLGDGTHTSSNVPMNVSGLGGGATIVAGGNHTCVLSGSEVWCWGQNSQGQLGDGTTTDRNVPVRVLSDVVDITAGLDYTCAVMRYGQVMCWGNNDQGQLADGTKTDRPTPTLAGLISGISNVDAGWNKSCGLTSAGLLRCLIGGAAQEIGGVSLDVAVNRFSSSVMALIEDGVPVAFQGGRFKQIGDVSQALDVDSGLSHVCALLNDGTVKCWGSNYYGQLGRNSTTSSPAPQPVVNLSGAWQLAVGKYHACVLIVSTTPGTDDILCWGFNRDGQLGDGTNENSPVPVLVK